MTQSDENKEILKIETTLANDGSYLCTGHYEGHRFIAEGATEAEATEQGYCAIDDRMMQGITIDLPWMMKEQAQ